MFPGLGRLDRGLGGGVQHSQALGPQKKEMGQGLSLPILLPC